MTEYISYVIVFLVFFILIFCIFFVFFFFFFFSSRRRHTRWNCDWSSDVCSSDLPAGKELAYIPTSESPTNVKFGRGGDAQTLFITAGKSLYRIRVERTGYAAAP